LAVTIAICFYMYITIRLGLKLSLFQQFLIKVKSQQIKWYQRLCIQYYKIKNMLGNVTDCNNSIMFTVSKTTWLTLKHTAHKNACFILLYSFCVRQFLVQIVLDVNSDFHTGLQRCDNYCSNEQKLGH